MELNHEQKAAVLHQNGPALILAGPGSGKTAVITCRTLQLIEEANIPAEKILVVTFSRKAAENMKKRFLFLRKESSSEDSFSLPVFGTFHSVFFLILRNAYGLTAKNIIREEQKMSFLREETERLRLTDEEDEELLETLLNDISCIKAGSAQIESFRPKNISPEVFRAIYTGYSKSLSKAGLIDFDDMLSLTLTLLKERPDILSWWQDQFRYILIDEFQDINPLQYEIIRLLALPENNLFAVGDDDQSIYGFRGTDPKIMQLFLKDYPDAVEITLAMNYRCCAEIQQASLKVIQENRLRFSKDLCCPVPSMNREPGKDPVQILHFPDQKRQYLYLADQISRQLSKGVPPEEIAILVRSSLQLPLLTFLLSERQIPLEGGSSSSDPFQSFIGEDLSAYLRIADVLASPAPDAEQFKKDFFRIINRPSRYITRFALSEAFRSGAATTREVLEYLSIFYRKNPRKQKAVHKLLQDLVLIRKSSPYAAAKYIRSAIGYEIYLSERAGHDRRLPEEYLKILDQIEEYLLAGFNVPTGTCSGLNSSEKKKSLSSEEAAAHSGIRLMTMHASKGLEFSYVYLPDLNENVLPVKQAERPEQIEEERRVFYVAMTRASKGLEIYFPEKMRGKEAVPSRFLNCLFPANEP
ncbi:MAG: ATP-dependent helicase [Parasporobacterium sp.]|nr:ATP-dependent helicase [Parasporobacterium sp.]